MYCTLYRGFCEILNVCLCLWTSFMSYFVLSKIDNVVFSYERCIFSSSSYIGLYIENMDADGEKWFVLPFRIFLYLLFYARPFPSLELSSCLLFASSSLFLIVSLSVWLSVLYVYLLPSSSFFRCFRKKL